MRKRKALMKCYILFVLLIVLAINLFGCKTADSSPLAEPDTVVESTPLEKEEAKEAAASSEKTEASENKAEQEENTSLQPEQKKEEDTTVEKEENTSPQPEQKNEEDTTAEQEKIPVYQSNAEGSLVFDFDDMQLTQFVNEDGAVVNHNADRTYYFPPKYMHYSDLMEEIGENGVIAAGYATGMRESFWKQSERYTMTDFVITDVYRGAVAQKNIKIKEDYAVILKGDARVFKGRHSDKFFHLKNDLQVLVFLKPEEDGSLALKYRYIPLTEDYKNYTDETLASILDFFRGDKKQYITTKGTWSELSERKEHGQHTRTYTVRYWPQRKVSDQALLEELNDHLLIRIATEYKIALWPYGHKNFNKNQYAAGEFERICMPEE